MEDIQLSRLRTLVGKQANATLRSPIDFREIDFTILRVYPPARICENFNQAVNESYFEVQLKHGVLLDVDGTGAWSNVTLPGSEIYWRPIDLAEASWLAE